MTKINPMWQQYPELVPNLTAVLALMKKHIHTDDRAVTEAILDMINSGGKLLRPAYCLLFSQFKPVDDKKMVALAASIETLHTATLIHDDVVDRALTRRNIATIQARFGQDVAVYAGDYLFVICFQLLANHTSDLRSIRQNAQGMEKILNGELSQKRMRYNYEMTIDDYLKQIQGKTAQLFGLACFVGAYESGNSLSFSRQCQKIGLNIGMAFQIMDDLLDYSQSTATLGKPVLEDVRQGVYSAPLLLALDQHQGEFIPYLEKRANMTAADIDVVTKLVTQYSGLEKAHALAASYTDKALKGLNKLPDIPAKASLLRLTKQLLQRQF
ncbi:MULTISPECIES: polyprenyl synthetase family protein [Loigolactobacillus]|uniref:Heptaprenyl diphosphate synthase n=1 Tax=Loigolactobacillus backii TaxID=375175 RepID=A0A192H0Y4_9LACO|nr:MULTISPECIES: polyprenyl synthetase family protein [Loigolactobacillus]ANK59086.1 heptaprenyl diphosphate synthase [Loigolactobacillus backii]ANK62464.1 heptaprenyl diphosphate synthase [Loigolactobacillus backii]ANK64075.1 heptaprenyl diphosphate synthase [Loigolactobacillus backii]ANK67531.1 heptaprenyl diphosphate synthase [Loigolactobacillus backii]ANK70524.1 heptaprenyl diphosphate synthase [Loigolactobacillus backii]